MTRRGTAMMLVTCRCGATLMPTAPQCGRCGARPLGAAPMPPAPMAPPLPPPMPAPPLPVAAMPMAAVPMAPVAITAAPERREGVSAAAVGLLAGLTALSLLLAGVAAFLYLRPAPVAAASAPVVVTAPSTPSVATTDAVTGTSSGSDTSGGTGTRSATLLDDAAKSDSAAVESLTGWWVPQLSSKKVGTVAHGRTYDSADILSHYGALQGQVPGALLLWSGDWPVFTNDDYWVVVAPQTFGSPAAANAWCDAQGFGPDDCLARRLSHSDGPSGSSVPRS